MSTLLICSTQDLPSRNMKDHLLRIREWEDLGGDGKNRFHSSGDMVMMTIPELHIYAESADREAEAFGIRADDVVFMSRHKAASAIPTLTVHPIGNYNAADLGGRERTLVRASPGLMTDTLRRLSEADTGRYRVSFEVTHHGPYLDRPAFFMETGSDESAWGDREAAGMLAEAICRAGKNDYPDAVGIGGGHYAPRFSEIALGYRVNFGHMIPDHALRGAGDEEILRMAASACEATGSNLVYLHRSRDPEASRISGLLGSAGFEIISSKDLDVIGNG